jgi:PHD/YefM family antitoxin component YafN of YafNO toxin-antitoxin module
MNTLMKLNVEDINSSLVEYLKSTFKGRKIVIQIYEQEEETDETAYLLSDPKAREELLKSVQEVKEGKGLKKYSIEELEARFLNDPGNEGYSS